MNMRSTIATALFALSLVAISHCLSGCFSAADVTKDLTQIDVLSQHASQSQAKCSPTTGAPIPTYCPLLKSCMDKTVQVAESGLSLLRSMVAIEPFDQQAMKTTLFRAEFDSTVSVCTAAIAGVK